MVLVYSEQHAFFAPLKLDMTPDVRFLIVLLQLTQNIVSTRTLNGFAETELPIVFAVTMVEKKSSKKARRPIW